jgi:tRNA A37 threonylcarbamoyladenosine synthetase subunit TsaC/SUA5/YrdC
VPHLIMAELDEPIMTSTLLLPGDDEPLTDGTQILERLGHQLDAVVDAGHCGTDPTTVLDLSVSPAVLLRQGKGVIRSV